MKHFKPHCLAVLLLFVCLFFNEIEPPLEFIVDYQFKKQIPVILTSPAKIPVTNVGISNFFLKKM